MAFPVSSVLDDFNRANSTGLGSNWSDFWGNTSLNVSSSAAVTTGAAWFGDYYNPTTYGPNCEVYATVTAGAGGTYDLCLRVGGAASAPNCYSVENAAGTWSIYVITGGAASRLGATFSQSMSNGDSLGLGAAGSVITAYYKASGGAWASLASRGDATYSSAGYLAMDAYGGTTINFDNFGGGTISGAAVRLLDRGTFRGIERGIL